MIITKFNWKGLFVLISCLSSSLTFAQNYSGGAGTPADPYQIANKADLKYLSEDSLGWANHYVQTSNITFSTSDFAATGNFYYAGNGFLPIALGSSFTGSYDGQNHTIEGIFINRSGQMNIGFFANLNGASIANLGLSSVNVTGDSLVGALVGATSNNTTINTCFSAGMVNGITKIGGLIGADNSSLINNCYSTATIEGTGSIAGFAGSMDNSSVTNSYASGDVDSTSNSGAFCGLYNAVTMSNCFWNSQTSGQISGHAFDPFQPGIIGLDFLQTIHMLDESTFTNASWDFLGEATNGTNDIWKMECAFNDGFPAFAWQSFSFPSNKIFVDSLAFNGLNDGTSWANAFTSLGEAFALANCISVDSILVAKGTYIPNRSQFNQSYKLEGQLENAFVLVNNLAILGGYPNGGGARDSKLNETILSGNHTSAHVVVAAGNDSTAILDGFTITEGGSDTYLSGLVNGYEIFDCSGGGIYASVAKPTIKNVLFINNEVGESGGGYFGYQSSPYFENVRFVNNRAKNGGGMANQDKCSPVLFNAYFASNWAEDNGGAIYNVDTCVLYILGAYIIGNSSDNVGGGISNTDSSLALLVNTQLTGNKASGSGGAFYNGSEGTLNILNATVSGNSASMGGGVYSDNALFQSVNSIVLGNTDNQVVSVGKTPTIVLSLIGNSFTAGNLDGIGLSPEDVFIDYADTTLAPSLLGNYELKYGSIAIDEGYDYSDTFKVDILGNPRFLGKAMDLGAFESFYCLTKTSITNQNNVSCFGMMDGSVTITQDSGKANFDYRWSTGDSTINTALNSSTIDSLVAGKYFVEITDAYGCVVKDSVSITEPQAIDTSTSLSGFVISSNATAGNYQWLDCDTDSLISGETSQSFSPTKNGNYAVIITDGNCSDTSACVSIYNLSASSRLNESNIAVYPNPSNGNFTVLLPNEETASIVVYNKLGQIVKTIEGNATKYLLDLNEVPGIYILEITTPSFTQSLKLIKK